MSRLSDQLRSLGACRKAVEFAEPYESLSEAWGKCEVTSWKRWLIHRLDGPAWTEYERVTGLVWAEYERVRGLAWAEYERVTGPALAEYERVRGLAWAEYERLTGPAWAEYERVNGLAWAEYKRVRGQCLDSLLLQIEAELEAKFKGGPL